MGGGPIDQEERENADPGPLPGIPFLRPLSPSTPREQASNSNLATTVDDDNDCDNGDDEDYCHHVSSCPGLNALPLFVYITMEVFYPLYS